ncbi:MAG: BrnA antitoxin family protein [Azoarcus sp.]|jgi:uncharacterized protein (DUF4415 family)|nr:BrnA antitoxin family protein [Azoarcus sp.]
MQTQTAGTPVHAHPQAITAAAVLADPDQCAAKRMSQRDVNVCLDRDILASLRATGPDWQVRFNAILRSWLKTNAPTQ